MAQTKPFTISKSLVYEAYKRVKANRGGAGIDGESLKVFEIDLSKNRIRFGIACHRVAICHHP